MKKRVIIFFNITLIVLLICCCEKKNECYNDYCQSVLVNEDENRLPKVEYIDEQLLEKSLWTNISRYCNKETYRNEREVIIALIDAGISEYYFNSTYLYTNYAEVENNYIDDDGNGYVDDVNGWNVIDNNGDVLNYNDNSIHASAMMGMLVGENEKYSYYGMLSNYNVKIIPIKSLNDNNIGGNVENIVKAVEYAKIMRADIVAMSFSTYVNSKELEDVIKNSDMLFVVAAGNESMELCETHKVYPACYESDNILTVASVLDNGEIDYCSNYGKQYVDIAAPGENIVCYLGNDNFVYEGGSSFAVPFVVASSAIITNLSEKKLTSKEIKKIIMDNVCHNKLLEEKVNSEGVIDIDKILEQIK